jgi:hypothetical protein
MRARLVRRVLVVLGAAAVLTSWLAWPHARANDKRWVVAPEPEQPGAVEAGADEVAQAQKLARKKRYFDAMLLLERAAREHPSALHDCNLALAYLRTGRLTQAQLIFDVSRLRGGTPPPWCDSSLAGQLAAALRKEKYVPLTLAVQPVDATIDVGEALFRGMTVIWLKPGSHSLTVTAPVHQPETRPLMVAPPAMRVDVALVKLGDDAPPEVDAGVAVTAPIDAARAPSPDASAGGLDLLDDRDRATPIPPPTARAKWPAYAGIGAAGLGLGLGLAFHTRALGTKDRANELPRTSPQFGELSDRFGTERALAIGGEAVSAAALGFTAWWLLGKDRGEPPARTIGASVGPDGALLTIGGTLP